MVATLDFEHTDNVAEGGANNRAIAIFATYLSTIILLVALITQDIVRATLRERKRSTIGHVRGTKHKLDMHAALAVLCLAITWYYMISFFSMSYQSWALDHEVTIPSGLQAIWVDPSIVKLGAWLKDVQLFRDAWEIVVETPGRYFWSQPIFVITTGWSFFIAMESRVLGIPYAWAYMALGQLVAISFAMNLFFLAVVAYAALQEDYATKSTKKSSANTSEEEALWTPPSGLMLGIIVVTYVSVALTPRRVGTGHFLYYLGMPHALLFVPLLLSYIIPTRLRTHRSRAEFEVYYRQSILNVTRSAAVVQIVILVQALTDTHPKRHLHRHSNVVMGLRPDEANPVESLFQSLVDHPAVSSVGWDSILCLFSIIAWLRT